MVAADGPAVLPWRGEALPGLKVAMAESTGELYGCVSAQVLVSGSVGGGRSSVNCSQGAKCSVVSAWLAEQGWHGAGVQPPFHGLLTVPRAVCVQSSCAT